MTFLLEAGEKLEKIINMDENFALAYYHLRLPLLQPKSIYKG